MAAVRPQFRVEVYLPDPDDPVLGRTGVRGARLRPVGVGDSGCAAGTAAAGATAAARIWRCSWPIPGRR